MPKPKTGHKLLNVRVSADTHRKLEREAKECEESVSTLLRAAIRHLLANDDLCVEPADRLPQ